MCSGLCGECPYSVQRVPSSKNPCSTGHTDGLLLTEFSDGLRKLQDNDDLEPNRTGTSPDVSAGWREEYDAQSVSADIDNPRLASDGGVATATGSTDIPPGRGLSGNVYRSCTFCGEKVAKHKFPFHLASKCPDAPRGPGGADE